MKFRITKTCRAAGKHCEPGDIVDLTEAESKSLLAAGRGVPKSGKKDKDKFFENTEGEGEKDKK